MSRDARLAKLEQRRAKAERARNLPLSIRWAKAEGEQEIAPASNPGVQINLTSAGGGAPTGRFLDADEPVVQPSPTATTTSHSRRAPQPPAVTWGDGSNPACPSCQAIDAVKWARKQGRLAPRVAIGLRFSPLQIRAAR